MRAKGKDITELFGYQSDDLSDTAREYHRNAECPFVGGICSKSNSDQSIVYGVCSVSNGNQKTPGTEVVVCPKRLYAESFRTLRTVADEVWGALPFVIGGTTSELRAEALKHQEAVVAFGQGSGNEVGVPGEAKLSMDWVLQRYACQNGQLVPKDFVGIEVQSIDITNNYRECQLAYSEMRVREDPEHYIPNSGHGLNWANVHKRLIPQILRKGNIYQDVERCRGFFFIVPEAVFQKFESVLGNLPTSPQARKDVLSVHTYVLGRPVPSGQIRALEKCRTVHLPLSEVSDAFVSRQFEEVAEQFDQKLQGFL
ncbi:restriction endonuclease [Salinisphaera sp. USBA-960]|nr:restriction endonuclease [Salifodinibacter halophilus]NNC25903.1 restriction endonuclease [Salifodinibacter halophilus]